MTVEHYDQYVVSFNDRETFTVSELNLSLRNS